VATAAVEGDWGRRRGYGGYGGGYGYGGGGGYGGGCDRTANVTAWDCAPSQACLDGAGLPYPPELTECYYGEDDEAAACELLPKAPGTLYTLGLAPPDWAAGHTLGSMAYPDATAGRSEGRSACAARCHLSTRHLRP
jgi:hypothetical protein